MKKLFVFVTLIVVTTLSSCKYDDGDLWDSVNGLNDRVAKLEELCKQMNTNISSLQTIVNTLQNNDYVTGVTPVMQNGKEVGYTITFSKGKPIIIYHGKDGVDGEDGTTPSIGVKQDTDGVYYWTLNGEWLKDNQGNKIKSEGADGTNGVTPKFKIENDYWLISYDNGATWTQVGKATGEDGTGGDSMFTDVDYTTSSDYVIFTLADGTQIKLPTWSAFEALKRLCNETNTNLSALQAIVTALQNNDYITGVDPLTENGKVIGYTIKFAKSNPIVIYNGKDGSGTTPVIGVKKDTDGIYYWTLDGEFIVVDGAKIKAQGTDGDNGSDGVTPKLEIRSGYWWISYDNGANWTQLGKATGEDGKDADSIKITQDENNVYFELADGTIITIPKTEQSSNFIKFEDINVKLVCLKNWDTDGDGELSYEEAAIVTSIGTLFQKNSIIISFKELKYFTGLTAIDDNAFYHCDNLVSIIIPKNVKSIGKSAFYGSYSGDGSISSPIINNSNLTSVILPEGLRIIKANAFYRCANLKNISIPKSVSTIDEWAFFLCKNLISIIIENGTIGKAAFSSCAMLKNVTIGKGVTSIGNSAFEACYNVNFYCQSQTPPTLGDDTFYTPLNIYVPLIAIEKYKSATNWRTYANYIIGHQFNE